MGIITYSDQIHMRTPTIESTWIRHKAESVSNVGLYKVQVAPHSRNDNDASLLTLKLFDTPNFDAFGELVD